MKCIKCINQIKKHYTSHILQEDKTHILYSYQKHTRILGCRGEMSQEKSRKEVIDMGGKKSWERRQKLITNAFI